MRVLMLSTWPDAAVDYVLHDLRRFLPSDIEAEIIHPAVIQDDDKLLDMYNDFDLIHMGYYGQIAGDVTSISPPITANVWHIGLESIAKSISGLAGANIQHLFADDTTSVQILGQNNITAVTLVPPPFDPARVPELPLPPRFTVGVFCSNFPHKRWNVAVEACDEADAECYAAVLPWMRKQYFLKPMRDVYPHISVLVNASFCDTGSLPCFEALRAGRPVITTHSHAMHRVVQDGVNGYFFDGSPGDLAHKISLVQDNLATLREGALATPFPDMQAIATTYATIWRRIAEEFA